MKNRFEKEVKKYQREIRSFLIIRTKQSTAFMAELKESMNVFIETNRVCDIGILREHFGSPEDIAKASLETADFSYIKKRVRIKNVITAVLLAAFILWSIFLCVGYAINSDNNGDYVIIEMNESEKITIMEDVTNE